MAANDYPSDWDSRRKDVYARDDYTCQNCGRTGGPSGNAELHAHHIVPKSKGGSHAKSNLVTVCKDCHDAIHGNARAPSAKAQLSGRSSGSSSGYFNRLGDLAGETREVQQLHARYSMLLSKLIDGQSAGGPQVKQLEKRIRDRCFSLKINLATFSVEDAPGRATDEFVELATEFVEYNVEAIDGIVDLMDGVNELEAHGRELDGLSCPGCDAAVEQDDAFCSNCGEDLSEVGSCPECGVAVSPSDQFCSDCGAEIEGGGSDEEEAVTELVDDLTEKAESLKHTFHRITAHSLCLTAQTNVVLNSENTSNVDWKYCPDCGYKHSVYETGNREGSCVLCEASWKKKGILSTKWKMTSGEYADSAKPDSEWERLGRDAHERGEYEDVIADIGMDDVSRMAGL